MHKTPISVAQPTHPQNKRSSPLRTGAILLLGFSLAPLLAEGALICYAQWSQVLGKNAEARTPMLDSLHEGLASGHQSLWSTVSAYFQRVPWSPHLVLAIGAVVVFVGMMLLKL